MTFLMKMLKAREWSIVLLFVAYVLFVTSLNPSFFSAASLSLLVKASVILLLMAVGQSFVLLTANIDVSVGSIMGLSAAVCGVLLVGGYSLWVVIPAVLIVGAVVGLVNGIGVSYLRVPSIIMTLGMLGIIRGLMLIFTKGMWIENIPNFYKKLSGVTFVGLNLPVWISLGLLLAAHVWLTKSRFGRYFFAVGDNADGARLVGIPVRKVTVLAFILSGVSAALASLVFVMNIGFVPNQTGTGLELQVIAAAVLGGVSLTGGIGTVIGAGLGAIFLTSITNSLVFLKIPAYWNNAIFGFLLLIIVVGDSRFQAFVKKESKIKRQKVLGPLEKGGSANGKQLDDVT
ncbi:Autoinducer 2 import system permease protein LsrC [Bacillus sp. THAF10]|uniref:ABC transporter permease subunit n=1 Tax=Bacillus sp. THAF10 TaxID=2587848 RepID=UPI0012682D2F|nr:sugar ABC transporter permease [Bacillus sp. THAF10]QFT90753.1 Autoinducer 2 import system permease protein LsrC [Bacillus sp. THAF10]